MRHKLSPPPPRSDENTISLLSPVQAPPAQTPVLVKDAMYRSRASGSNVSCRSVPPCDGTTKSSLASELPNERLKAIHCPSGEKTGSTSAVPIEWVSRVRSPVLSSTRNIPPDSGL